MRFTPQFLDELRARLSVSEVVGRRVQLKKSGSEWRGLSPFNKERTPSFFVNDQKSMWFDFSAGKNGNIFDFLMLTEGLSFPEAVERLAGEAGVPLPKTSREDIARQERSKTLHDITEVAAKFFEGTLASRAGARARGYLTDRAIDPAIQLRFRLGYAPNERFALKEHLGKQGIVTQDMVEAGLLVGRGRYPCPLRPLSRPRHLPDHRFAQSGHSLRRAGARSGRARQVPQLAGDAALPQRSNALQHGCGTRGRAQRCPVVAVEGYVDVIAMVQAGYEATVAPLGTSLTTEQLELLWRLSEEPTLCFDGDAAGRRARISGR